jgi:hypothetical protein
MRVEAAVKKEEKKKMKIVKKEVWRGIASPRV